MANNESNDDHLGARTDYGKEALHDADLPNDPFTLLKSWLRRASEELSTDHNSMMLSTVGERGPSSRIILLRGVDEHGLEFFTNYNSRKGQELAANGRASLLFFWPSLERQIRIEGNVTKCSTKRSDEYFASRPRESQLSACASKQSEQVNDREALEAAYEEVQKCFADRPVSRPEHWGGYVLSPDRMEFWQGRPGRLHDRIVYRSNGEEWERSRLQP